MKLACHNFNKISAMAFSQVLEKFNNGSGYIVPKFLSYNIPCSNDIFFRYPDLSKSHFCVPGLYGSTTVIEKDLSESNRIIISYVFNQYELNKLSIKTINVLTGQYSSITLDRFWDTLIIKTDNNMHGRHEIYDVEEGELDYDNINFSPLLSLLMINIMY